MGNQNKQITMPKIARPATPNGRMREEIQAR